MHGGGERRPSWGNARRAVFVECRPCPAAAPAAARAAPPRRRIDLREVILRPRRGDAGGARTARGAVRRPTPRRTSIPRTQRRRASRSPGIAASSSRCFTSYHHPIAAIVAALRNAGLEPTACREHEAEGDLLAAAPRLLKHRGRAIVLDLAVQHGCRRPARLDRDRRVSGHFPGRAPGKRPLTGVASAP